ncbi:MAG: alpha amylase C-terminal domain-containing protein [Verrucomicrobia bacterium]|nr:alpha amylase C-terminal domain-containing protein [Verrucomicrobiota bacterium]
MASAVTSHLYSMRSLVQPETSSKADILEGIETRFSILHNNFFLTDPTLRTRLLKERVSECHQAQFPTVLKIEQKREGLEEKLDAIQKVSELVDVIKRPGDEGQVKSAFNQIPFRYQQQIYWTIWMMKGMPLEDDFGRKVLEADIFLLNSKEPLVFLIDGNLAEQLLYRINEEVAILKQKAMVETFQKISDLLYRPICDPAAIAGLLESLPENEQLFLYYDVYYYSTQPIEVKSTEDWGRKELHRNPNVFKEIRIPSPSSSMNLFEHHFKRHQDVLKKLQTAKELEEFERITVLYQTYPRRMIESLLGSMSASVRSMLSEVEASESPKATEVASSTPRCHDGFEFFYEHRGAHIDADRTTFEVFAPHARNVQLQLCTKGVVEHTIPMDQNALGEWKATTRLAPAGTTYRYQVEDANGRLVHRTDPFSFSTVKYFTFQGEECTESRVVDIRQHEWKDGEWIKQRMMGNPREKPLSVYESHVELWRQRDGRPLGYRELAQHFIQYCEEMNITHLLLYGLMDSTGGWGFHVQNFFAPNPHLGTTEDFQAFVDELHQHDIGVLLMWIPAHYKEDPVESSLHDWDGTNLYSAGTCEWESQLFDFTKPEVCALLESSLLFWLEKLHCDGISMDAVSHIVSRNGAPYQPGIRFLQNLNKTIKERVPGALIIGEEATAYERSTDPVENGGYGFDLVWGADIGTKMRRFLQTGFEDRPAKHQTDFMQFLRHVQSRPKMIISHSHDESANRNWPERYPISEDKTLFRVQHSPNLSDKFADMRNFFGWQILAPNRGSMIHMGDEFGQRRSWDAGIWTDDESIEWHLLDPTRNADSQWHQGLQLCVSDLLKMYREHPAFWKTGEAGFRLCCDHSENNVIAYERSCPGEDKLYVVHNFSNNEWQSYRIYFGDGSEIPSFDGLREIFNSNQGKYGGAGTHQNPEVDITWAPESGRPLYMTISVPPLSTMVFEENNERRRIW